MRVAAILILTLLASGFAPVALQAQATTAACRADAQGRVDYKACADAAPAGSPERSLALINLGSEAVARGNYAAAAEYYDEAVPKGSKVYSDPVFHALRAQAFEHVGRTAEALSDASIAYAMMGDGKGVPEQALRVARQARVDKHLVYSAIVPILHRAKSPEADAAAAEYAALPTEGDWARLANRGWVMAELGRYTDAIASSEQALALQPDRATLLNNHCAILGNAGRPAEALPFCERALKADSTDGEIHDSRANVLAKLGRCEEAAAAMVEARRLLPKNGPARPDPACRPSAG